MSSVLSSNFPADAQFRSISTGDANNYYDSDLNSALDAFYPVIEYSPLETGGAQGPALNTIILPRALEGGALTNAGGGSICSGTAPGDRNIFLLSAIEASALNDGTWSADLLPEVNLENFQVGTSKYAHLEEIVAAVPAGGTITMLRDVKVANDISLVEDKAYTIDFGGHILTSDGWSGVGATLGQITLKNGTVSATNNEYTSAVTASRDATINTLNGTYVGYEDAVHSFGEVNITSGRFISTDDDQSDGAIVEEYDGTVNLAVGSAADQNPWKNASSATDVTITNASAPPVSNTYTALEHFGTYAGAGTSTARVDADHAKFVRLLKDSVEIPSTHYGITPGSTVITRWGFGRNRRVAMVADCLYVVISRCLNCCSCCCSFRKLPRT